MLDCGNLRCSPPPYLVSDRAGTPSEIYPVEIKTVYFINQWVDQYIYITRSELSMTSYDYKSDPKTSENCRGKIWVKLGKNLKLKMNLSVVIMITGLDWIVNK